MSSTNQLDPAAVFAGAKSLFDACHDHASHTEDCNLSDEFNGVDELMRVVMTVATEFEQWASAHVAFNELGEVWPYFLEDQFGSAVLKSISLAALTSFDEHDFLHVAAQLALPLRLSEGFVLPINLRASNPVTNSTFKELQILAVRFCEMDGSTVPLDVHDDPRENWSEVVFGLYGIGEGGLAEHIADRSSYAAVRGLALAVAPGIDFPEEPIVYLKARRPPQEIRADS